MAKDLNFNKLTLKQVSEFYNVSLSTAYRYRKTISIQLRKPTTRLTVRDLYLYEGVIKS